MFKLQSKQKDSGLSVEKAPGAMRCLQTNLGRGRAAHDKADVVAKTNPVDLIIISKPNINIVRNREQLSDNKTEVDIQIINTNKESKA